MKLDKQANVEKVIILPFYGEFGWFLNSHIRLAHYFIASNKIVCCRKGEEVYFPSANNFFYDWKDIFEDYEKCGFRNTWPISPSFKATAEEERLKTKLKSLYPEHRLLDFQYAIPPELVQYFPIPIQFKKKYGIKVDIVICARKRHATGNFGDHGIRNFEKWPQVIVPLLQKGYRIGIVGKKETSYDYSVFDTRSWEYKDNNSAIFEMLSSARIYIGTDTGPTHLAALLKTPMILFRNENETLSPNLLNNCILPIARNQNFYAEIVSDGWNNPTKVVETTCRYLNKTTSSQEFL